MSDDTRPATIADLRRAFEAMRDSYDYLGQGFTVSGAQAALASLPSSEPAGCKEFVCDESGKINSPCCARGDHRCRSCGQPYSKCVASRDKGGDAKSERPLTPTPTGHQNEVEAAPASHEAGAVTGQAQEPIPMLLFCPKCGEQHVDAPEPERGWTNPPHKSHLCHTCGCIWRPAAVETEGVRSIHSRGSHDSWVPGPVLEYVEGIAVAESGLHPVAPAQPSPSLRVPEPVIPGRYGYCSSDCPRCRGMKLQIKCAEQPGVPELPEEPQPVCRIYWSKQLNRNAEAYDPRDMAAMTDYARALRSALQSAREECERVRGFERNLQEVLQLCEDDRNKYRAERDQLRARLSALSAPVEGLDPVAIIRADEQDTASVWGTVHYKPGNATEMMLDTKTMVDVVLASTATTLLNQQKAEIERLTREAADALEVKREVFDNVERIAFARGGAAAAEFIAQLQRDLSAALAENERLQAALGHNYLDCRNERDAALAELEAIKAGQEPVEAAPQPAQHELKCWPEFYSAIESGEKNFEIRRADRNYQVGDILTLREWNQRMEAYTGRECQRRVTYILEKGRFGLLHDFLCMGVQPLTAESANQIINQQKAEIERVTAQSLEQSERVRRMEEMSRIRACPHTEALAEAERQIASARSDAMREAECSIRGKAGHYAAGQFRDGILAAAEHVVSIRPVESSSGKVL